MAGKTLPKTISSAAADTSSDGFQHNVSFKGFEHKAKEKKGAYALYSLNKQDLAHILQNWDSVAQFDRATPNKPNAGAFHGTAIPRKGKPAVPLAFWVKQHAGQKLNRVHYDGVGQDEGGRDLLSQRGEQVDAYDPFHADDHTRTEPHKRQDWGGQYDEVHSHYTLNVVGPHTGKGIVQRIHDYLKPDGRAVISVRRDLKMPGEPKPMTQKPVAPGAKKSLGKTLTKSGPFHAIPRPELVPHLGHHDADAIHERLLEEKLKRHFNGQTAQMAKSEGLAKKDGPAAPPKLSPEESKKLMDAHVARQKFETGLQTGLATHQPKKAKEPKASGEAPSHTILTDMESNAKTAKNAKVGAEDDGGGDYLSAILHLAPASLAGVGNVCPAASPGCEGSCLNTSGQGGMQGIEEGKSLNHAQAARIAKTKLLHQDPGKFMDMLVRDISNVQAYAKRDGKKPVIRLNGTSDIAWEDLKLPHFGGKNIFESYPDVQFYDYTKRPDRMMKNKHSNYHLTFSRSEKNEHMARRILDAGHNVAAVFGGKQLPTKWNGYDVISGDDHDLRFLDPRSAPGGKGYVVGLKAKADAKDDDSGFTIWGHEGDPASAPNKDRVNNREKVLAVLNREGGAEKIDAYGGKNKKKAKKSLDKSHVPGDGCEYCQRLDSWSDYRKGGLKKYDSSIANTGIGADTKLDPAGVASLAGAFGKSDDVVVSAKPKSAFSKLKSAAGIEPKETVSTRIAAANVRGTANVDPDLTKPVTKSASLQKAKEYVPQKKVQSFKVQEPKMPKVNVPVTPKVPDPTTKIRDLGPIKKSQYAKTEEPATRQAEKDAKAKVKDDQQRVNKQLKAEVIASVTTKAGKKYDGMPADPKKTLRGVSDKPAGKPTNGPRD